jgi:lysophospholipase L1-like esterase
VLEPNTTEAGWFELSSHEQMRAVANAHGVPVVELHRYVHENRGRGLLWWDYVHPTSFGHKLIAECLTREIRNVMQAN